MLFTHRKIQQISSANGVISEQYTTDLYVGHNDGRLAKLVITEPDNQWNDLRAFWSPDSKYFVAIRNVQMLGYGRGILEVYSADGTLRWQRKFASSIPVNAAIQYCGEPFPRYVKDM